jgi:hypothetical protein
MCKKKTRLLLVTSNPPKLLINPKGRVLQQQVAPTLSKEKWMDAM